MIFIHKIYKDGEERINSGFLLFPKTINFGDFKQTRWLSYASWIEQYYTGKNGRSIWIPLYFISFPKKPTKGK